MAELADALDSGSSEDFLHAGSSPVSRTSKALEIQGFFFFRVSFLFWRVQSGIRLFNPAAFRARRAVTNWIVFSMTRHIEVWERWFYNRCIHTTREEAEAALAGKKGQSSAPKRILLPGPVHQLGPTRNCITKKTWSASKSFSLYDPIHQLAVCLCHQHPSIVYQAEPAS